LRLAAADRGNARLDFGLQSDDEISFEEAKLAIGFGNLLCQRQKNT
jgi:hypothetical protein